MGGRSVRLEHINWKNSFQERTRSGAVAQAVEQMFNDAAFQNWLGTELELSDVIVLNDFQKGFFTHSHPATRDHGSNGK
jgi:hypothetical protein